MLALARKWRVVAVLGTVAVTVWSVPLLAVFCTSLAMLMKLPLASKQRICIELAAMPSCPFACALVPGW